MNSKAVVWLLVLISGCATTTANDNRVTYSVKNRHVITVPPGKNKVDYTLTGLTNPESHGSWSVIAVDFEIGGRFFNLLERRLNFYLSDPTLNYQSDAEMFFQDLSGIAEITPESQFWEWNNIIKPMFEELQNKLRILKIEPEDLWRQLWVNADSAKYFVDIFRGLAPNPLNNEWLPIRTKEITSEIAACRYWGASFNLKFERMGQWSKRNSYLTVAQNELPLPVRQIWYDYPHGTKQDPILHFNVLLPGPNFTVTLEDQKWKLMNQFQIWLSGNRVVRKSSVIWLEPEVWKKELHYGDKINLQFKFRSYKFGKKKQEIKDVVAVQDIVLIIYYEPPPQFTANY